MQFQISSRRESRKRDTRVFKIRFLKKFLANNFPLSDAEDNTSGSLNTGGFVDLSFDNTISNLPKVPRAESFRK